MDQYKTNSKYDSSLNDLLDSDRLLLKNEIERIEFQIAEREKIKQRNLLFLESQRRKLEDQLNQLKCYEYNAPPLINSAKSTIQTQMVNMDLRKGEEYVSAFRDVQRLEEMKRNLLSESEETAGWAG